VTWAPHRFLNRIASSFRDGEAGHGSRQSHDKRDDLSPKPAILRTNAFWKSLIGLQSELAMRLHLAAARAGPYRKNRTSH